MYRTISALFLGLFLLSCAAPSAGSGQQVTENYIRVRAPSRDWQAQYNVSVPPGESVNILLSNVATNTTLNIIDFRPNEGSAEVMAGLQRDVMARSGLVEVTEVVAAKGGDEASFRTTALDGTVKGKITFVRRSARTDLPIAFIGRWPAEHDRDMVEAMDFIVASLAFGR